MLQLLDHGEGGPAAQQICQLNAHLSSGCVKLTNPEPGVRLLGAQDELVPRTSL